MLKVDRVYQHILKFLLFQNDPMIVQTLFNGTVEAVISSFWKFQLLLILIDDIVTSILKKKCGN